jgi:uncharacterized membrane protein
MPEEKRMTVIDTGGPFDRNATNVNIIYYLYLASIFVGITAIVAVIMAYINRGSGSDWLDTHYTYQIRTFWIGVLYIIIGGILSLVLIGFLILALVYVWVVVRSIKGLKFAGRSEPVPNPKAWLA